MSRQRKLLGAKIAWYGMPNMREHRQASTFVAPSPELTLKPAQRRNWTL
jgi:hypothetical protein